MSRTLHLFGTDWCAMMVPIQVIRWYRMQCYDGTDSCATVVPIRRYCQMGRMMMDKTPRLWHVVGSNLNYAFIINNDTILEKTADGALDVYDAHMNPVKNYHLPAKQFDQAIKQLNRFFK